MQLFIIRAFDEDHRAGGGWPGWGGERACGGQDSA